MSFKPEVKVFGETPFHRNGLVFETYEEALNNARDLRNRWILVEDYRAVEVDEPVNYKWVDGKLLPVEVKNA